MKHLLRVVCAVLALGLVACEEPEPIITPDTTIPSLGTPADNEIWFTTSDNRDLWALNELAFNATITDVELSEFGISVIRFDKALTTIGEKAFYNCRNLSNISLPTSITTIGAEAFAECTNLECLTICDKITSCGANAFDNCIALNSLHVPSVGDWCNIKFANPIANPLYHCGQFTVNGKRLKELIIPEWIKTISPYAFYGYTTMTSIEIPKSITSIGEDAFAGCDGLSKVNIKDLEQWCKIEFEGETANPLSVAGTLYINGNITTNLSLEGISTISERAFIRCSSLQSVVANDVKEIGIEAFRGCTALTSVTLGAEIQNLYGRAFMGCMALKSVTVMATNPPALGDKYVFDYNADGRKIYVPSESLDTYKSNEGWSRYADSIEALN